MIMGKTLEEELPERAQELEWLHIFKICIPPLLIRRGSSTNAPIIEAAMVMGKTLEEDFQKEHKNSNGCTSSRSVCRPADPPWWQHQSTNIKICMPPC